MNSNQDQDSVSVLQCLDDLSVLDLDTFVWYALPTQLAPLPRKGHSLNVVNLGTNLDVANQHFVVFGGYSTENLTVSNTLVACSVEKVQSNYQYQKNIRELEEEIQEVQKRLDEVTLKATAADHSSKTIPLGDEMKAVKKNLQTLKSKKVVLLNKGSEKIVWKSLSCRGQPPVGRYRHSATVLQDSSGSHLLVIIGGIGSDSSYALSDVHILQCDALTWITLPSHKPTIPLHSKSSNRLTSTNIQTDRPYRGIYGHVAFPFYNRLQPGQSDEGNILFENEEHLLLNDNNSKEILIFGGSYDTIASSSSCYSTIFAYHVVEDRWRIVQTGHEYPTSRINHTASVILGFSPDFNFAFSSNENNVNSKNNHNNDDVKGRATVGKEAHQVTNSSVIIFGGVTAMQAMADCWALDLNYREIGLAQFDNSQQQLVEQTMKTWETTQNSKIEVATDANENILQTTQNPTMLKIHSVNDLKYLCKKGSQNSLQISKNQSAHSMKSLQDTKLLVSQSTPAIFMPSTARDLFPQQFDYYQLDNVPPHENPGDMILKVCMYC
jgi:hypothetical protein